VTYLSSGYQGLSLGVKPPRHEADYPTLSSAMVKSVCKAILPLRHMYSQHGTLPCHVTYLTDENHDKNNRFAILKMYF
jgi:hypothetical protein